MNALWTANYGLAGAARWQLPKSPGARISTTELVALVDLGIIAALAASVPIPWFRIPGHAILRGTLPLILGVSLVPRRTSGSIMSLAAAATCLVMRGVGTGVPNPAAWVGLLCLGPAVDVALSGAKAGWTLYLRFAMAGMAASVAAFAVRIAMGPVGAVAMTAAGAGRGRTWAPGSGMGGGGMGGGRGVGLGAPIEDFWLPALASFALCGAIAGFLCAAIWFRARPRQDRSATP
jgi:hypothetical protein